MPDGLMSTPEKPVILIASKSGEVNTEAMHQRAIREVLVPPVLQPDMPTIDKGVSALAGAIGGVVAERFFDAIKDENIRKVVQGRVEASDAKYEKDDFAHLSYGELRVVLSTGRDQGKKLDVDAMAAAHNSRQLRYEEAAKYGAMTGVEGALKTNLVAADWHNYQTAIARTAVTAEREARGISAYANNSRIEGVVYDAVSAVDLLARRDGLRQISNLSEVKNQDKLHELKINNIATELAELDAQISNDVLWDPIRNYAATIDEETPQQREEKVARQRASETAAEQQRERDHQENLVRIQAEAQVATIPASQGGGSAVGRPHRIEDYDILHDTAGIFKETPGHGLYALISGPVVNKLPVGNDFTSGRFNIFIELNKFAEGKGSDESFLLTKKLLEYVLPGKENISQRDAVMELAKLMNATFLLSDSADYTKLVSGQENKGLIASIDPRSIAKLITLVPEMQSAFKFYWEKFNNPDTIAPPLGSNKDQIAEWAQNNGAIWTEANLQKEEAEKAKELKCCVGIIRAVRHFVSDFGIFPQAFTETRKMATRYPELFVRPNGAKPPAILLPGMGFSLVEINGSRTVLMNLLKDGKYAEFLKKYSDTSAGNNTDRDWTLKMWGSINSLHDPIANIYKNALSPKLLKGTNFILRGAMSLLGMDTPEMSYLVNQNVMTARPYKMPLVTEITATAKGTRTLKPDQVEFVLNYLFNLKMADKNNPDGRVANKNTIPVLELFGTVEAGIVNALKSSLVFKQRGLDEDVQFVAP